MKNLFRKIVGGGTRRLLASFLLASLMLASATLSSFAANIPNGTTVRYTTGNMFGDTADFHVTYNGTRYTGCCAEKGVDELPSGSGSVNKYGNNSAIRKMLYKMVVKDGWWDGSAANESASDVLGVQTGVTKHVLVASASQINKQGWEAWYDAWCNSSGASSSTGSAILQWFNRKVDETSSINVPDEFQVYFVDAGNGQSFTIWAFEEPEIKEGKLGLKKASAIKSITG